MKSKILIFTCTLIVSYCFPQKTISSNNQQWFQYYTQFKLSKKLVLMSDIGYRIKGNPQDWFQTTTRTGIAYPITKSLQGVTGIACFTSFKNATASILEMRSYQEINATLTRKKMSIQNRLRVEARAFQNMTSAPNQASFNFRLRYRLYFTLPLFKLSSKKPEFKILLNFGDELFINFGKEIVYNTFDNNRILLAPSLQINKQLTISLTYSYQYGHRSSISTYESSHILWLGVTQKFGFKEKAKK